MLARLVDRSLIYRDAPGRFAFHILIRQLAEAKLSESPNADVARRRHLNVFKELAIQGEKALRGSPDQLGWSQRLEQEQPNFRTAIEWGIQNDLEAASRLAGANWLFYYSRGHLREARQIYDRILGSNKELPDEVMGWLYNGRCSVALAQEDVKTLQRCGEKALLHFEKAGLRDGIALSYHHLADVAASEGDQALASRYVERGLSFSDSTWTQGLLRQHIARAHFARGELDQAAEITSELVEACQSSHDRWTLGHYRYFLAHLEAERGNTGEARRLLRIGLEEADDLNDTLITIGISWLGGLLALAVGNPEEAIGRIQNALDLDERSGANRDRVQMQVHLTAAHLDVGQMATARRLLRRTSEDALHKPHQTATTDCLMQLARLDWTTTRKLEAVTWLASAAGNRKKTSHTWDSYVRSVFDDLHRQMLEVLPPEQFSELWQMGQRQTPAALLLNALAMESIR